MARVMIVMAAVAAAGMCGCGGQLPGVVSVSPAATIAGGTAGGNTPHRLAAAGHGMHRVVGGGLLAVHDPGTVTGTLAGPCRTRHDRQLPDPSCTPGAIDPVVTQANIGSTICRPGYTTSVRPPESQTERFKWDVAEPAYGQHNVSGELDHLVPLELGGANDAHNLWVEAGPVPNPKDVVENTLNQAVCDGRILLRTAQMEIARNWIKAAATLGISIPQAPVSGPPASVRGKSASCTAAASYNSQYADWDVYIHSGQPDATVTASSGRYSHTWHTDSDGYADVYLRGPSLGQAINVTVGSAHCSTTAG